MLDEFEGSIDIISHGCFQKTMKTLSNSTRNVLHLDIQALFLKKDVILKVGNYRKYN